MATASNGRSVVVVTGSAGFIGARIVEALRAGYRVVGVDRKRPRHVPDGTEFVECDLSLDASTEQALAAVAELVGRDIASVIHLAAHHDFSGAPSPLYQHLNVEGTRRLLKGLRAGFQVEQFVFSSTILVLKAAETGEVLTEESPVEPTWSHPLSKAHAEQVIREEHGDIPTVILRIAGVYTDDCQSVPIAQHISRIYERKFESYWFPGNAEHGQSFVHLDDVVTCVRRVVESRHALGAEEVFLVGEPDVVTYAQLQDLLGELIRGKEWPTIRIPKAAAKAGAWAQEKLAGKEETFIKPWMIDLADAHYPVDITRAKERLGWEPRHLLRTTIEKMVASLKRDPAAWYRKNKLPMPEGKGEAREAERPAHA